MTRPSALGSIGRLWRASRVARLLLAAWGLGAILLALVPLYDPAALLLMGKLHLRGPFLRWALLQPVPSMYNFANVVRFDTAAEDGPVHETRWLNHYPLRALTYMHRGPLLEHPATLYAESRYGTLRVRTRCRSTPRHDVAYVACEAID